MCAVDYCLDQQTIDALDKKSIKSSEDMAQKQIKRVLHSEDVEIISYVKKGTPYEEILKEQENKKINLIVIATHGRTGLMSYLLGSVAEKVVRHASCAVFLVRGK